MKPYLYPIILLLILCLLTACVSTHQLEKLGLASIIGYDLNDGQIEGTTMFSQFDPNKEGAIQVINTKANTSKGIRQSSNLGTSNELEGGQLRVILFGQELAEQGIFYLTDTLAREASIGTMIYLCISKGDAKSIITAKLPIPNNGKYLYDLLRQNVEGELILSSTLHEFWQAYYDPGKDPILPLIEYKDKDLVASGLAVMNGDKYVGSLKATDGFYLKLVRDKFKAGATEIKVAPESFSKNLLKANAKKDDVFIVVDDIRSKSNIELKEQSTPTFKINIKVEAQIIEVSEPLNLENRKAVKELEHIINTHIKNDVTTLVLKLQELNSDPIGFGSVYNGKIRNIDLTEEKWDEIYPKAQFEVEINTRISHTGVTE